jgi:2',3'-cyclic-nucleotide 2'-phosphodiesterase (5'-nucleotidase family)
MTDGLRLAAKTDIALMNSSGIRAPLEAGDVTYEDLYRVLPFNNLGVVVGPMPAEKIVALMQRSIESCGAYGALMPSGLRVRFERDCDTATNQVDRKARLLTIETLDGEAVYDAARGGLVAPAGRTYTVATLDFLVTGGGGYDGFKGTPVMHGMGIAREAIVDLFAAHPATFSPDLDGRFAEQPRKQQ